MERSRLPSLRLRARAELERRRRNGRLGAEHEYDAYGHCATLQTSDAPQVVLSGPAGTGKSRACLEKIYACACDKRHKGLRAAIVRKTRASLTDTGLVTWERDVLGLEHSEVVNGAQRRFRHSYRLGQGAEVVVAGLDRPSRILSAEYDLIYVQQAEELTENDWETLTTRLRSGRMPYQQLIGDCNPEGPQHWLKLRADRGQTQMLETRHEDNPTLWDMGAGDWTPHGASYIAVLDALTGARKERLRYGRWVQAEGVVYEEYDAAVHLIDAFPIPADWWRFRVVDFGYTNPLVVQWWALDGDGRMYRYREMYMTGRTVAEHAAQILEHSRGERIEATVCDHDAEDRATLALAGVPNVAARKDVSVGIQAVKERLKVQGDGKPRLFLLRDSLVETDPTLVEARKPFCTEQEVDGYVWNDKTRKEEPVKANDHGMDAMRYGVMLCEPEIVQAEDVMNLADRVEISPF